MLTVVKVAVDKASAHFDKLFDYLLPAEFAGRAVPGCRVLVPFGNGNRKRLGLILEAEQPQQEVSGRLKPVADLVDLAPVVDEEMLRLIRYLKSNTFCTYFDALKAVLPSGIGMNIRQEICLSPGIETDGLELTPQQRQAVDYFKAQKKAVLMERVERELGKDCHLVLQRLMEQGILQSRELAKRRVLDEKETMVRLAIPPSELESLPRARLTAKQQAVAAFLAEHETASLKETLYYSGATRSVLDTMKKNALVCYFEQDVYRNPYEGKYSASAGEIASLSPEQQAAADRLLRFYQKDRRPALLYGVTGSGKTQVYLWLINQVLTEGRTAMVLVPEISLTPQTVAKFHAVYGERVAVLHSGLSLSERLDEWKRVRDRKADIVVGTRSAVFAPLKNLGVIVIDEEQESSYKSEASPRYHAREVAKFRAKEQDALLILASATPSIESYYYAQRGKYHFVTLETRFTGSLPPVGVVDMNAQLPMERLSSLSDQLCAEIQKNLRDGKQTILLLNRRGYQTIVKCSECGTVCTCPNCSISMTYHSANGRLVCHYCGFSSDLAVSCPKCGSSYVRYSGVGTQKIEESIREIFPQARVLRMDADTTMAKFSHQTFFDQFSRGEYDIMIGTQMVAKGLDFPNVTLVGVISADASLYADDFRGAERTFGLITQVVGRGGRAVDPGRAYIQTFSPDSEVITLAARQNYRGFYENEITARRLMLYPPFCDLCAVCFLSEEEAGAKLASYRFAELLKQKFSEDSLADLPLRVLGPSEAAVARVNRKYRYKIILKCKNTLKFRSAMLLLLSEIMKCPESRNVTVYADMNFDSSF